MRSNPLGIPKTSLRRESLKDVYPHVQLVVEDERVGEDERVKEACSF